MIASQLKAIKALANAAPPPPRGPQTRPSILYDPKEAADIDLQTLLPIALSGLEELIDLDKRFLSYAETLFSQTSLELNRQMMNQKENEKLNKSIHSYLRLLSGHLLCLAARKTLEYLIRRYMVHVYNIEELVLCALPYHDTHVFVQIVQLIEPGNTKWGFLEGVKSSGAAPPRHVLVQQCIRDKGLLETLCNYASANRNFQHPMLVISFCTAVIVETLGSMPKLDTDTVQRVLGFVFGALNLENKAEREHKAGALMIIGLLATRATLASKLIHKLLLYVAMTASHDANESLDLPWLRVTIMALISLVQSQHVDNFPEKIVIVLQEIRDFIEVLYDLSKDYNIQRFISVYLESLITISNPDNSYHDSFVYVIEKVPLKKDSVEKIISKVLTHGTKMARSMDKSNSPKIGKLLKKIRAALEKHYPSELQASIRTALEKGKSVSDGLGLLLDRTEELVETFDSKLWVSLEHPKAEIRKSAMKKIAESSIIKNIANNPQEILNVQDTIIRGLSDDNLSVVQATLSIEGMAEVFSANSLLQAYQNVLSNCTDIITKGASDTSRAINVMVSCIERMVELQSQNPVHAKDVALTLFPLLVVRSKTSKVNYKAVELFNAIKWPFFAESSVSFDPISFDGLKTFDIKTASAINLKMIESLSRTFVENPKEYIGWLAELAKASNLSKCLFLQITLHALSVNNKGFDQVKELYQICFCSLKDEWSRMGSPHGCSLNEDEAEKCLTELTDNLSTCDIEEHNSKALVCIFWCLLKACASARQHNTDGTNNVESVVNELFLFFCSAQSKHIFNKHLQFLAINCTDGAAVRFLSKYFAEEGISTAVQVESLRLVVSLCEGNNLDENFNCQLLLGLPSFFIPLSHEDKDIRVSAMNCIESLLTVWRRFCTSLPKNGSNNRLPQCVLSDKFSIFLEALVDQKYMITSDANFLSSYLASMLGSPCNDEIMVPDDVQNRFDRQARDNLLLFFLNSALGFSSYGKLMLLKVLKGIGTAIYEVEGVKRFVQNLMERWNKYHLGCGNQRERLTSSEVDILCLLLEVSLSASTMSAIDANIMDSIAKALRIKKFSPDDFATVQPVVTILRNIKPSLIDSMDMEVQDKIFGSLVLLLRNENNEIRNATRETLLRLNVSYLTVRRLLDAILFQCEASDVLKPSKRKKMDPNNLFGLFQDSFQRGEHRISFLLALLDMLLLKKDLVKRVYLLKPLLQVLSNLFSEDAVKSYFGERQSENGNIDEEMFSSILYQARQLALIVLKDIMDLLEHNPQDELFDKRDIDLLVVCARSATDASTRNLIFALISSVAKFSPQLISENITSIFSIIGGCALKQDDSHSQHVVEDLIASLVPCWLLMTTSVKELLQIFIEALPDLPPHRRLMLLLYLSRTLGEECSLGIVIYLLLDAKVKQLLPTTHDKLLSNMGTSLDRWECTLALQLCQQYSCKVWFPSLVSLLKEVQLHEGDVQFPVLFLTLRFIMDMLQDTELIFELESQHAASLLQVTLGTLMEHVVLQLQNLTTSKKQHGVDMNLVKEISDLGNTTLKSITRWMVPSTLFTSITQLLGYEDRNVQRKALVLLCETLREEDPNQKKQKKTRKLKHRKAVSLFQLDESSSYSFNELCSKLVQLINIKDDNSNCTNIIIASISSLEVLASKYPEDRYTTILPSIANHIASENVGVSSAASRASAALIHVLGSKALPQLPIIMKHVVETAQRCMKKGPSSDIVSNLCSVLSTLETVVEKLSGFLNPYLEGIMDLVLLHAEIVQSDLKLALKAASVRKLLTEKIPVRLLLQPLLQLYTSSKECGEMSLSLTFEMLSSLVSSMDRPSVGTYHAKIFEHCLGALDIRRETPASVKNIDLVEQSVINALTGLTMRLTESMFRPLFLHSIEWVESEVESGSKRSFDRAISFYRLVNRFAEQHRSLFVPYFKYLLESCVRFLAGDEGANLAGLKRKKKKAKIADMKPQEEDDLSLAMKHWHLKTLVVKSLQKCFLYDSDRKILDSSNFEVLLKPIVAQFVLEPPLSSSADVPTVEEMDESLVLCLGQMALTAKSDVLWKPLNHEVLMQTRNEKVRPKILGLKVIRHLVEHLKEEYMVFLPETIPFLGELLEDADLSVKTLAQEILKEMETLSGESLRQYL